MLNELAEKCSDIAAAHGFVVTHDNIPEKLMLTVSELAEALEDHRAGKLDTYYEGAKPCGFGVELADAIIRILDITHARNIDIDKLVSEKMAYNEGRPFKHGKAY